MRILLTADPELPVPPRLYGGIERIIDMLARGLSARGHEVTLLAHPDSATDAELMPWPGRVLGGRLRDLRNARHLASAVRRGRFDLVHSFSRLAYLAAILPRRIPKVMTYQRAITPRTVRLAGLMAGETITFTGISDWMIEHVCSFGRWRVVPNGVRLSTYRFNSDPGPDAPLVFLGRVEEIKGPHLAIEMAHRTGRRLVIAGNIPNEHRVWVEAHVMPHVDGARVEFIGPVDDRRKSKLLGSAAAFLMPILWEEPFGIVMAEAMACGTPVLGLRRGAVPEVVDDGVTGFVRDDLDALVGCVEQLGSIRRQDCRDRVERLYSEDAVVSGYLDIYREILDLSNRRLK